jgi:hypothetical protein
MVTISGMIRIKAVHSFLFRPSSKGSINLCPPCNPQKSVIQTIFLAAKYWNADDTDWADEHGFLDLNRGQSIRSLLGSFLFSSKGRKEYAKGAKF